MVEPIGDDELQRLREYLDDYSEHNELTRCNVTGRQAISLLARLDAAEARCVDLQREVEQWKRYEQEARFPC